MLLAWFGFPGIGYLCLGTVAVSFVISALFMREAGTGAKLLID
jgi:predicted ATP-grasp superfamily ATP-dependent carboligase